MIKNLCKVQKIDTAKIMIFWVKVNRNSENICGHNKSLIECLCRKKIEVRKYKFELTENHPKIFVTYLTIFKNIFLFNYRSSTMHALQRSYSSGQNVLLTRSCAYEQM